MATLDQAVHVVTRYHLGKYGITGVGTYGNDVVRVYIDTHRIYPHESTRKILECEAFPFKVEIVDSAAAVAHKKAQADAKTKLLTDLRSKNYEHLQANYGKDQPFCGCHVIDGRLSLRISPQRHSAEMPEKKPDTCPECYRIRSMIQRDYDRAKYRMNQQRNIQDRMRRDQWKVTNPSPKT